MSIGLYYYTLLILLISVMSSAASLSVHLVTRRRTWLFATSGFCFYFLDVALTFRTAIVAGGQLRSSSVFEINSPVESTLLGAGLTASFWLVVLDFLQLSYRKAALAAAFFVGCSVTALVTAPDERWREFLFFSTRELVLLLLLAQIAWHYAHARDRAERKRLWSHRSLYISVLIFTVLTVAWNIYFLLVVDYTGISPASLAFLPERNFAENALMLACAAHSCRCAFRSLRMRYEQPPQLLQPDRREEFVRDLAWSYGHRHGLSERECEVLFHLVQGKDNRTLASTLFVALSTVKVHIHHILAKTGHSNRTDLTRDFWASC